MKNRIFVALFAACFLLICPFTWAQTSSNPVGVWTYDLPDVPSEYSTGKVEFKMQDDKLMMVMYFNNAPQGNGFVVTKKDDKYICEVSFDNFSMGFTLGPDGDNLKGMISTDYGDFAIFMKPEKKSQ